MGNFMVIIGLIAVTWIVLRRMSEIKKIQLAQNEYIYKALKEVNPDTPPPATIEQSIEPKKPVVWSPKNDIDYIMSGKKTDMFD